MKELRQRKTDCEPFKELEINKKKKKENNDYGDYEVSKHGGETTKKLGWFDSIHEIREDLALQIGGVFLSLGVIATYFFEQWRFNIEKDPICHPYLMPRCYAWREWLWQHPLSVTLIDHAHTVFGLLGLVATLSFFASAVLHKMKMKANSKTNTPSSTSSPSMSVHRTLVNAGWVSLLLAWLLREPISYLDYRFRHNAVYMLLPSTLLFLIPRRDKRDLVVTFYTFCYWWAGTLKFNHDWLNGTLFRHSVPWFPEHLIVPSHCYVVFLELVLAFGLMSSSPIVFYGCLVQFVFFHLVSSLVVSWFYPAICLSLLGFFVAQFCIEPPTSLTAAAATTTKATAAMTSPSASKQREQQQQHQTSRRRSSLLKRLFTLKASKTVYVVLLIFGLCNVIPKLHPGKTSLTGECRQMQLHMLDASTECQLVLTGYDMRDPTQNTTFVLPVFHWQDTGVNRRIVCQPTTALAMYREYCLMVRDLKADRMKIVAKNKYPQELLEMSLDWRVNRATGLPILDASFYSKLEDDEEFNRMFHVQDVCHHKKRLRFCGVNGWIAPSRFRNDSYALFWKKHLWCEG